MHHGDDKVVRTALLVLGVYQLGLGGLMAFAPATFYDLLGPFDSYNAHYVRDAATWELTLAAGALVAAARAAWRVPVLALALVHTVLHALNHLLDVGEADPSWVGIFVLAGLTALAAALAWLTARAHGTAVERRRAQTVSI